MNHYDLSNRIAPSVYFLGSSQLSSYICGYLVSYRNLLKKHERNPFCYICNLFFAPEYLAVHLKTDHTKEELAAHLLMAYFDEWYEQEEAVEKAAKTSR